MTRRAGERLFLTWVLCLACHDATGPAQQGSYSTTPAGAIFVTADIDRFWEAYDAGGSIGAASAFQSHYLDAASPGLRDFIQARSLTAASLTQMVGAYPRYFAAIRANTLRLAQSNAILDRVRRNYDRIEALYPASIFPPVTFLIGRFSTAGTVRQSGILVGTEFFAIDDTTPLDELGTFQRVNARPLDSLPVIIAHEHTHVLQSQAGAVGSSSSATLLEQSLHEGIADFVGELVSGSHINTHIYAYGLLHEGELWAQFTPVMNGTDVSQWLYNQGSATGDRPGDLGYFIGYRIAGAYYGKAADKVVALREIIEMKNAAAFLAASGYTGAGLPASDYRIAR
jgi:predicted Zn-dependent protease DUF2268